MESVKVLPVISGHAAAGGNTAGGWYFLTHQFYQGSVNLTAGDGRSFNDDYSTRIYGSSGSPDPPRLLTLESPLTASSFGFVPHPFCLLYFLLSVYVSCLTTYCLTILFVLSIRHVKSKLHWRSLRCQHDTDVANTEPLDPL